MDPFWEISLLGGLSACRGELRLTSFTTRRAGQLLAYLAYHQGRPQPREVLAEWLWPDEQLPAARRNLTVELSRLRQQLEPAGVPAESVLRADHFSIELQPGTAATDVGAFRRALSAASRASDPQSWIARLEEALALYRGELLPGFYDEWIVTAQEQLRELHLRALREVIGFYEGCALDEEAVWYALQWSQHEPYCEEAHYTLMRLYAATNRPEAALRQYSRLEEALRELELRPASASRDLCARLRAGGSPLETRFTPAPSVLRFGEPNAAPRRPPGEPPPSRNERPEPAAGAMPLQSPYYVERSVDAECLAAIATGESIVLVRGPRQVGKSSLLARALEDARRQGRRVALTDVQLLNRDYLTSAPAFLGTLGASLAGQLGLARRPHDSWDPDVAPNLNFQHFLQAVVLPAVDTHLVWALDETDLLFEQPVSSDLFRMFRSWHNARALDPCGPWSRLSIVMAYATEPRLLALDPNLSPWNVGTKLTLEDFTDEQCRALNQRYGRPLTSPEEEARYFALVGGQPFLVRCGLRELARRAIRLQVLEARADEEGWIFGEHLRRMAAPLAHSPRLVEVLRSLLAGKPCRDPESFERLVAGGMVTGACSGGGKLRCGLYARYLRHRLARDGS